MTTRSALHHISASLSNPQPLIYFSLLPQSWWKSFGAFPAGLLWWQSEALPQVWAHSREQRRTCQGKIKNKNKVQVCFTTVPNASCSCILYNSRQTCDVNDLPSGSCCWELWLHRQRWQQRRADRVLCPMVWTLQESGAQIQRAGRKGEEEIWP